MATQEAWTVKELLDELCRFEVELRAAGLAENTIRTYVDRSTYFVRWLSGDYEPRGPHATDAT
jgi:hypothetical protein